MLEKLKEFLEAQLDGDDQENEKKKIQLNKERAAFIEQRFHDFMVQICILYGDDPKNYIKRKAIYKEAPSSLVISRELFDRLDVNRLANDDDKQVEIAKSFLSPDYSPPSGAFELYDHFHLLWIYYRSLVETDWSIPISVGMRFDFILARIIEQVAAHNLIGDHVGYHKSRTSKRRKNPRKEEALSMWKADYKGKEGPYAAGRKIYGELLEKYKEVPTVNTIAGWIKKYEEEKAKKVTSDH